MLRTRTVWYSLAILLGSFTGCSCESEKATLVNPEAVHQSYSVSHDAGTKKTTVNARFRFGGPTGTNLELDGLAKVVHSSCELKRGNLFGVHYAGNCDGFQADHEFTYTDTAGKIYKNAIHLASVDFPADMPAEVSRSKPFVLSFVGDAIAEGDRVDISITQMAQPQAITKTNSGSQVGSKQVSVTEGEMQSFAEGEATIVLTRQQNKSLQAGTTRGGGITASYATAQRKVAIVK